MSELTGSLRDLHLPEPVGWWPPAPGWWMVATSVLVAMAWVILQAWRRYHSDHHSRTLSSELCAYYVSWQDTQATAQYYRFCSEALRRKAIGIGGRDVVSRLSGQRWVDWLDSHTLTPLSDDVRAVLADGVYHRAPPEHVPVVHRALLSWASDNA